MRVISQDGTMDFPYDSSSVSIYGGCVNGRIYVRAQLCGGYDDSVDVADYSTKAKAIKAMEMLREVYASMPIAIQNVNTPKGAVKTLEMVQGCGISNTVFQFPQDDEIEV